jgi:outer membrane protease
MSMDQIYGINNLERGIYAENRIYIPKKFSLFLTSFGNISIEVNENVYFGNSNLGHLIWQCKSFCSISSYMGVSQPCT